MADAEATTDRPDVWTISYGWRVWVRRRKGAPWQCVSWGPTAEEAQRTAGTNELFHAAYDVRVLPMGQSPQGS